MIEYPIFYRKFGIRRPEHLINPVLWSVNALFLPFNSLIHYLPETETAMGIGEDNVLLQQYKRPLWVEHVKQMNVEKGSPRPMPFQIQSVIMKYQRDHKRTRLVKDMETVNKDRRGLIVINHAMAPHAWRYMETNPLTPYNKWYNEQLTLWSKVEEIAKSTDRNQFVVITLPKILPAMSLLIRGEGEMSRILLGKFSTDEDLTFLEIWKWLGKSRENSLLNKISSENLKKVNLVFLESGRWTVLNLGTIDEWRSGAEAPAMGKLDPLTMQKRFLKMSMSIKEATSVTSNEEEALPDEVQAAEPVDEKEHIEETPSATEIAGGEIETIDEVPMQSETTLREDKKQMSLGAAPKGPKTEIKPKMKTSHTVSETELADIPNDTETEQAIDEKSIDADIEALEKIGKTEEETPTVSYTPYRPKEESLEAGVITAADNIAKKGLITAAEYRRFTMLAGKYKTLPNPYSDKGTLADLTVIPPEVIKVEEKNPIAEKIAGVQDPSMLNSSLKEFDKRYIEKVLPKDTVSMALNIQKAGIAIQNYTVEKSVDLLDEYETHTIKVVPVVGAPSTVRFRVPTVDKNGIMKVANVRYRMRKQRGD